MTDIKAYLNEYGIYRQSAEESWDYSTLVSLGLCSAQFIQRFLRERYHHDLVVALSGEKLGLIVYWLMQNMTLRTAELFEEDLVKAAPTSDEINIAQQNLLEVFEKEHKAYEREIWEQYAEVITSDIMSTRPDITVIEGLSDNRFRQIVDSLPIPVAYGLFHDEQWSHLLSKINPENSSNVSEALCDLIEMTEPSFLWQMELSKRIVTLKATGFDS